MNTETVITIERLHKRFDAAAVLKDVSLDIQAGSIVGLVGANGAGKSTLIRHMVGLTCQTGERARRWAATQQSSGLWIWRASDMFTRRGG